MEFKQVVFKEVYEDENTNPSVGIACYNSNNLQFIVCACCGGVFEPDEVEIVKENYYWINFTDAIKGDD